MSDIAYSSNKSEMYKGILIEMTMCEVLLESQDTLMLSKLIFLMYYIKDDCQPFKNIFRANKTSFPH